MKFLLYELLQKTPINDKLKFCNAFHIEIPDMHVDIPDEQRHLRKNPFSYCYLSDSARIFLDIKIDDLVKYYVRNYFKTYDLETGNSKKSILLTMNKLNLGQEHFDRMIKEYQRFKSSLRMQKKRKNLNSSLSIH